jgi:hypothetical protein
MLLAPARHAVTSRARLLARDACDPLSLQMLVPRPRLVLPRIGACAAKHVLLKGHGMTGMVSFRLSAERLRQLKEQATADITALGSAAEGAWVSSNDALVARFWQASTPPCMQQGRRRGGRQALPPLSASAGAASPPVGV